PRLLRGLRRDRSLRGQRRCRRMRGGVTEMAMAIRTDEPADISVAELAELNERFEREPATGIISWAVDTFHPRLCLTASMTDAVLIDLAVKVEPSIEVVFIDTGYHFPETLETVELVRRRYGLNLRMMTVPPHDEELWRVDPENCCSAIKVFFFQAEDGIRDYKVTGVQTCALPI